MFDKLKDQIKTIKEYTPPNIADFYDTISLIHNLVPPIWKPRRKGYTQKAARILFFQDVTERDVKSSRDLWHFEIWSIHEYITGISGVFTKEMDEDYILVNHDLNKSEFQQWCLQNAQRIRAYAEIVGEKEREKAKTKRKAKKQEDVVPF